MGIQEAYIKMQEESNFKIGDKVKILRKAKSYEMGWRDSWIDEMDKFIGKVGKVEDFVGAFGVFVAFKPGSFHFPFFVLEKVEEECYCIGDKFKLFIDEARLFQVDENKVVLISLFDFNRFGKPVLVKDVFNITKEEMSQITIQRYELIEKSHRRKER